MNVSTETLLIITVIATVFIGRMLLKGVKETLEDDQKLVSIKIQIAAEIVRQQKLQSEIKEILRRR